MLESEQKYLRCSTQIVKVCVELNGAAAIGFFIQSRALVQVGCSSWSSFLFDVCLHKSSVMEKNKLFLFWQHNPTTPKHPEWKVDVWNVFPTFPWVEVRGLVPPHGPRLSELLPVSVFETRANQSLFTGAGEPEVCAHGEEAGSVRSCPRGWVSRIPDPERRGAPGENRPETEEPRLQRTVRRRSIWYVCGCFSLMMKLQSAACWKCLHVN